MSRRSKNNGTFVDTRYLRDHVSKLRQEKKYALRLYETVRAMRSLSDPEVSYKYNSILRDADDLVEYFTRMANALAHIEDEAIQTSRTISGLIENDTEETRRTVSKNLML